MAPLELKFLNSFQATLNGSAITKFRSSKVQALLIYLAMQPERAFARDAVTALLWPDETETRARQNSRQSLYQLRRVLRNDRSVDFLLTTRQTVQFDLSNCTLDVHQFELAIKKGDWAQAAKLYAGELLPGFNCDSVPFDDWLRVERERLHRQALDALQALTTQHLDLKDSAEAKATARRQLALEPWREVAHRQLMQALALAGDRSAALAQYDRCIEVLWDELGVEVSAETDTLYQQIREQNSPTFPYIGSLATPQPSAPFSAPNRFKVRSRLEALPDQQLFGIDAARDRVAQALTQRNRPWIVAIDGLGGIGKTTLANAIVEQFLGSTRFADIGWVSAKQEEYVTGRGVRATKKPALDASSLIDQLLAQLADGPYPTGSDEAKLMALAQILQEKPCLIVVDNLETAIDYEALLPLLRRLVRPSKFLLTSRLSLQFESDVFCHSLHELALDDALALLRHESAEQQIQSLLNAGEAALTEIYTTVGGNPLALKLVLGQAHFLPLPHILEQLRLAKSRQIDQLYSYIYWQAWQMLDQPSRDLWISLPLMPNGTFEQLITASQLDALDVQAALTQLKSLSLVQVGSEFDEPRYRLHRLTETFLLHEVIKWGEKEGGKSAELTHFQDRIHDVAHHWQQDQAIAQMDIATLDREKDAILTAIHFGLTIEAAWPAIKAIIFALTNYMERRSHWEVWFDTLEKAIKVAQTVQDIDGELALMNLRGRILQRQGRSHEVIRNYWNVIRIARRYHNQIEEARASSNLGFAYIDQNHWWRSEIICCHALMLFEAHQHKHGLAHTHNHLGILFTRQERWAEAEQHLSTACQIWEAENDEHGLIYGLENLANLYLITQQPNQAIEFLLTALNKIIQTGESAEKAGITLNLARSYLQSSDIDKAKTYALKAEKLFQKRTNLLGICRSWLALGMIHAQNGYSQDTKAYFDASEEGFRQLRHYEGAITASAARLDCLVNSGLFVEAASELHNLESLGDLFPRGRLSRRYKNAMSHYKRLKNGEAPSNGMSEGAP